MTSNAKQKFNIIVDDHPYFVEIIETSETTLHVIVDGQSFQVQIQPEHHTGPDLGAEMAVGAPHVITTPDAPEIHSSDLTAPLPGNITEIFIKVGDQVEAGQALCVIDAMKMKNVLRSPRSGNIAAVEVSLGETVPYNKTLIRFV
jgi:biotin carboxyl carrier protein